MRNRQVINKRLKEKYHTEPQYRMKMILCAKFRNALKRNTKTDEKFDLIGCSIKELKSYLEERFIEGMTWSNYGQWHIDHKKPCALFDLTDSEQQKECFHYTNLQPLWALDNVKKFSKYETSSVIN